MNDPRLGQEHLACALRGYQLIRLQQGPFWYFEGQPAEHANYHETGCNDRPGALVLNIVDRRVDLRANLNWIVSCNHNRAGGTRHLIISSTSGQRACKVLRGYIRIALANSADLSIYAIWRHESRNAL